MKNQITFVLLILLSFFIKAQNKELNYYKTTYPNSNYVKLKNNVEIKIGLQDGELKIYQTNDIEEILIGNATEDFAKSSVAYTNFIDLIKVKASSFSLKNGKYKEHKVKEFKKKDEMTTSFHDDYKSLNFFYSHIEPGVKTKLTTVHQIKNPRFFLPIYFGGNVPHEYSSLKVEVDNDVKMDFKMFNIKTHNHVIEKRKKTTTYFWDFKNIPAIEVLKNSPSYQHYYPHIIPIIKEYKSKSGVIKEVSSDTDALFKWYNDLVKNIDKNYSTSLISTVKKIIKGKKTELDKVEAIYYWVQNNIKYVAFEYDLGGFIPRDPNEVFEKKYGDCKDNSILLYAMLEIAKIKSALTWIGTRSLPYTYEMLPTPATDNHMILSYENDNKIYYLDATGRFMPLGFPTSFIQGKEALISSNDETYKINEVPVANAQFSKNIDSIYLKIKDKALVGKGVKQFTGYNKLDVFNTLEKLDNEKLLFKYYRFLLRKGNNKFSLNTFKEHNKYSYVKPFKIEYDFTIPNYISSYENEYYVDLNLIPFFKRSLFKQDRNIDFEAEYKKSFQFYFELEVPDEYLIDYIPKNIIIKNKFLTSKISYQQAGNVIVYKHLINLNYLILKKENFEFLMSEVKKIAKAYKELIILKKK